MQGHVFLVLSVTLGLTEQGVQVPVKGCVLHVLVAEMDSIIQDAQVQV